MLAESGFKFAFNGTTVLSNCVLMVVCVVTSNFDVLIVACIAAIAPTIAAVAAVIASRRNTAAIAELHIQVNSRLSQLLERTEAAAKELGRTEGRETERDRKKNVSQ